MPQIMKCPPLREGGCVAAGRVTCTQHVITSQSPTAPAPLKGSLSPALMPISPHSLKGSLSLPHTL